ncbi:MAG: hypothetical protein L0H74_08415 [Brachybacterium sp.]|nr:hypothetical protein [Brachybacterium sp.]
MSRPPAEDPRTGSPRGRGAPGGGLAHDASGSPKNFGLNVKRLRLTRIIVLGVLSPLILLLALLAVRFVSMPITQATHLQAYEGGEYSAAVERLGPVEFANWFEPYLPHLSKGTALLQQGQDAAAEEELRIALEEWTSHSDLNSPMHAQCKILNNLAISIERQADLLEDPQQRADRLFEAEQLLAPCAGGGGGGEGEGEGGGSGNEDSETTEDNGERVEEKRREADEEAGNDPDARGGEEGGEDEGGTPGQQDPGDPTREDPEDDGPDEEAPTDGDSEEEQKDDELEKRNRDAQGGDGDGDPGETSDDPVQPW